MRFIAAGLVIATCIVSAALAQDATPPAERPPLLFDMQPDGRAYARNYPHFARDRGYPGAAVMCCTPRADRTLDCNIAFEGPADYGFGEATLAISREFRLHADSYAEVQAHPERLPIRRTIVWRMGAATPAFTDVLTQIRERTADICNQPAVEPASP